MKMVWIGCALMGLSVAGSAQAKRKPAAAAAGTSLGQKAFAYTKTAVGFGPRYVGSPGHAKVEQFLKAHLKGADVQVDEFTMKTPLGDKQMRNYIAKYPGTKDGVIVIAGHYDTLFGRNDFVGANDGGSSTGLWGRSDATATPAASSSGSFSWMLKKRSWKRTVCASSPKRTLPTVAVISRRSGSRMAPQSE